MAIQLTPKVYLQDSELDCSTVIGALKIIWGRRALFDDHRPGICEMSLIDTSGYYGKEIGANTLLGQSLSIVESSLNKRLFFGFITEISARPYGQAWIVDVTATDPTATLDSAPLAPLSREYTLEQVRLTLKHRLSTAAPDIYGVKLVEGFSPSLTLQAASEVETIADQINVFYGSQYGAAWEFNPETKHIHGVSPHAYSSYIYWEQAQGRRWKLAVKSRSLSEKLPVLDGSTVISDSAMTLGVENDINTVQIKHLTSGEWKIVENDDAPSSGRRIAQWTTHLKGMASQMLVAMLHTVRNTGNLPVPPVMHIRLGRTVEDSQRAKTLLSTHSTGLPIFVTRHKQHSWLWPLWQGWKRHPVVQIIGGTLTYHRDTGYAMTYDSHWSDLAKSVDTPATWSSWRQDSEQFYWGDPPNRKLVDPSVGWGDMANIDKQHMEAQ